MIFNFNSFVDYVDFYRKNGNFYVKSYISFIKDFKKKLSKFFPVFSNNEKICINLNNIYFTKSKESVDFCKINKTTYNISIKGIFLIFTNEENLIKKYLVRSNIISFPFITNNGSFIINGLERTVVSYLKKSPGIYFLGKNNEEKKFKVIPKIGAWIDFFFDDNKILKFKINKGKPLNFFYFLNSFMNKKNHFKKLINLYLKIKIIKNDIFFKIPFNFVNNVLNFDVINTEKKLIFKKNTKINKNIIFFLKKNYISYPFKKLNFIFFKNYIIGGKKFESGSKVNLNFLFSIKKKIKFKIYNNLHNVLSNFLLNSYFNYRNEKPNKSKIRIINSFNNLTGYNNEYKILLFRETFLNNKKFVFDKKTRKSLYKLGGGNKELDFNNLKSLVYLFLKRILKNKKNDLDNLINKKIVCVGDVLWNLLENKIPIILKKIINKMNVNKSYEFESLINFRQLNLIIREFFCSSQFSQFLDQNNDLSELTHKRRINVSTNFYSSNISSLPLRNIHISRFGKICPIETPEGVNIGLVNSLSIFSKINKSGDIISPYLKVKNGKILKKKIYFLNIEEEKKKFITTSENLNKNFQNVFCRNMCSIKLVNISKINYCDFSPLQIFSIAPLLVPFMENNDANRVLMGSNMQRQSVVCLKKSSPYVGTGLEFIPSYFLNYIQTIKKNCSIEYKEGNFAIVKYIFKKYKFYNVVYFKKINYTNQGNIFRETFSSCKNILKEGKNTDNGKVSLGQNLLTAFLPFLGYNFEDSIVISERVANSDMFCSAHFQEFTVYLNYNKEDNEFLNKDLFLINKENYDKLDNNGIIKEGSFVHNNDVLVAKISLLDKNKLSPEKKLINVLLKNKGDSYKEIFYRLPNNVFGTVVSVIRTNRKKNGVKKEYISEKIKGFKKVIKITFNNFISDLIKKFNLKKKNFYIKKKKLYFNGIYNKNIKNRLILINNLIYKKFVKFDKECSSIYNPLDRNKNAEMIKIKIVTKKKLEVGDKMSGRHGNKGVVSKILPIEDMPFLSDGTPCDLILNPLGIPSRMNIGQVFEVNMGFFVFLLEFLKKKNKNIFIKSVKKIKKKFPNIKIINKHKKIYVENPPFIGFKGRDIKKLIKIIVSKKIKDYYLINDSYDKLIMFDGETGKKFNDYINFGYMYFLKLNHLVCDKIHSRSTGPYSLVAQQPLRGKSNFGGQRFGEMEVWALEAYGASYILQEMLTLKSDDILGRNKIYKNIYFSKWKIKCSIPESFNILLRELKSLYINIEFE